MIYDVVVGNPPFGDGVCNRNRHFKIMRDSLVLCKDKLVFIMPSKPITVKIDDEWLSMLKSAVCTRVDVVGKEMFPGTQMDKTAIYFCDRKARKDSYDKKFDVDERIYNMIDEEGHRLFIDKMGKMEQIKKYIQTGHKGKKNDFIYLKNIINKMNYYLNINGAYGSMGGVWMSGIVKDIPVMTGDELIEFYRKNMARRNILFCPSYEYGVNLKKMFCDSLVFKYGLWLTQFSHCIYAPQFKYVPDLDYSKIDNDTDLLLACGFTSDEAKTVLDYLKSFDFTQSRNDMVRDCS